MQLKLIVIRCKELKAVVDFYMLLGLQFEYHQHGNSPMHYSATLNGTVVELYPLAGKQTEADSFLRIGLGVDDLDKTIANIMEYNIRIAALPKETTFGKLAIVEDPEGRKVELYQL